MALTTGKKDTQAAKPVNESEKVKAAAEAVAAPMDDSIYGSKSHLIEFVAPLGDPSNDDATTIEVNGKKDTNHAPTIVGYQFRVLEDMEVPECGTGDDLKTNPMSFKDPNGKRMAKAGEIINLTRFETGMLLSPPEFNARATGGQMGVVVVYSVSGTKTANGTIAKASDSSKIPTVSLRAIQGSVKDVAMVHVLEFTSETTEKGRTRKHRTINPGFEKWAPLCVQNVRKPSAGATATPKTKRNTGAETFLKIVAAKK